MNPFTTDHPLASQPSWFDAKHHPFLSALPRAFVLALLLTPLVLWRLYCYAISDIGAEPNPFPNPWLCLACGTALAFGSGMFCALPAVRLLRLLARLWKKRQGGRSAAESADFSWR